MHSTEQTKVVHKYLQILGIDSEATQLYLVLVKQGHSSALQLAKLSSISRTQVYRHMEALQGAGLVSAEQLSYGTLYHALPIGNIEALIANREAETAAMRRDIGAMEAVLKAFAGSAGPNAAVRHYYGMAGLKQASWNLTKADKELRVLEAGHPPLHFDRAFARRQRERLIERELISYDLTNDTTVLARDIEPFEPSRTLIRHIDPEVLTINFEVYIYNDVVTLLDYSKDQQIAIEIQQPALHAMMRQMYEAMWRLGTPIEIR